MAERRQSEVAAARRAHLEEGYRTARLERRARLRQSMGQARQARRGAQQARVHQEEEVMNRTLHVMLHENLHKSLDALVADFIRITSRVPSKTTVMELIAWSHDQCSDPVLPDGQVHEEDEE